MPRKGTKSSGRIYQLKITLRGSKPPIWRRVLVHEAFDLQMLHEVILRVMGWHGGHLHQFVIDNDYYSTPSPDDFEPVLDERRYKLNKIAPEEKCKFRYEYDFGDNWEHDIVVEKILPPVPDQIYPQCIKGKRACPPEDVGGVWGYEEFLGAISDPNHEEHESMLEWVGGEFDPEAFDMEGVNRRLKLLA